MERNVFLCVPTAGKSHVREQFSKWCGQGYRIAALTNGTTISPDFDHLLTLHMHTEWYPGVWKSWNLLARAAFGMGADVVVLAGDDMDPDPRKTAREIADEYFARFRLGEGVMQPCGDPQGDLIDGQRNAGRICGSPWIGPKWIELSYGYGAVCEDYYAFYADEELKILSEKMGLLWLRQDLMQYHRHWSWGHLPKQDYHERNQLQWNADQRMFLHRKGLGFPPRVK
jgi:hypothetical protein